MHTHTRTHAHTHTHTHTYTRIYSHNIYKQHLPQEFCIVTPLVQVYTSCLVIHYLECLYTYNLHFSEYDIASLQESLPITYDYTIATQSEVLHLTQGYFYGEHMKYANYKAY